MYNVYWGVFGPRFKLFRIFLTNHLSTQARRKQFRVGPAKIGLTECGVREYTTGVRGHAPPGNFEI